MFKNKLRRERRHDHSYGTGIEAFLPLYEKNNAVLDYGVAVEWFKLRIVLPNIGK